MFRKYFSHLRYFDWLLMLAVVVLISFGLAAIYSITKSYEVPNYFNLQKQAAFAVFGLVLVFVFGSFNYHLLKPYSLILYAVGLMFLLVVIFFGISFKGTTGWLSIFGFTFQPVEISKLTLIIILAKFFSDQFKAYSDLKFILVTGVISGIYFILTVIQPDFGSALILFLIWFMLLIIAGVKRLYMILMIAFLVLTFLAAWFFLFQDYQKDRIMTFLNPNNDPYNQGYQVRQAIIAVGSGGIMGRGLGFGSQSQLKFLPAAQTDFIFAVIAEELGFLGAGIVLAFFALLFYRMIIIARRAPDNFGLFLVLAISALFFCQFFINVGMNIGLLPVTGIGLPCVSYGGSFLVVCLIMVGIVQSVGARSIKYKV